MPLDMVTGFPDLQRQYDDMWEAEATRDSDDSDEEALDAEIDEIGKSDLFPNLDECRAVGLSYSKYQELVRMVAQRRIDDRRFP